MSPYFRVIIDGPGSGTVFNGHAPLRDELYTLTNHYVSGKADVLPIVINKKQPLSKI